MPGESISVLLIEEDEKDAERIQRMLGAPGRSPVNWALATSLKDGLRRLADEKVDIVLLGLSVPGALATNTVDRVHSRAPDVPIIVLTSLDETQVFLDTARGGAVDYLVKTRLDPRELVRAIRYAIERTHMVEARRRAEASLRQVVSSSADAMVVVDAGGKVRFLNPAAEQLFGRTADAFVGREFDFALAPGETKEVKIHQEGSARIAEMRVVETEWEGKPARLASLRDITESVQMREELRARSLRDELTGLYNRRGFTTLAQQQLKLANRSRGALLLVFADLNDMKAINDEFGHGEGDRALKKAAAALTGAFRDSDIVARMGGDEFAVLAVGARQLAADVVNKRVQEVLNSRLAREELPYEVSLSVGCVRYDPASPCTLDDLLARADEAMYQQKRKHAESD